MDSQGWPTFVTTSYKFIDHNSNVPCAIFNKYTKSYTDILNFVDSIDNCAYVCIWPFFVRKFSLKSIKKHFEIFGELDISLYIYTERNKIFKRHARQVKRSVY